MNKMAIKPVGTYTVQKQEFLNSVINKIGRQEYANQVYKNPLARLNFFSRFFTLNKILFSITNLLYKIF